MTLKVESMQLTEKLALIQLNLKAPKSQYNKFGKYPYRNCEDILSGVKPILAGLVLNLSDEIVVIGDRFYVKATASISDGETAISTTAFARESLDKKGMDSAQITGAASSYARKYALNGLFAIDDTKDADHGDEPQANKPAAQLAELKGFAAYNPQDFEKNITAWYSAVHAKKISPDQIIAKLLTKNTLTNDQISRINNLKG